MADKTTVLLASNNVQVTSDELNLLFSSITRRMQDMQMIPSNNYSGGKHPPSEFIAAMDACSQHLSNLEREYFAIVKSLDKSILLAKSRPNLFQLDNEYFEAARRLKSINKISRTLSPFSKICKGTLALAGIVGSVGIAYWLSSFVSSDLRYVVFTICNIPFWAAAVYVNKIS
jgi:hypothetical protein